MRNLVAVADILLSLAHWMLERDHGMREAKSRMRRRCLPPQRYARDVVDEACCRPEYYFFGCVQVRLILEVGLVSQGILARREGNTYTLTLLVSSRRSIQP